jgi:hypothetical protein
MSLKGTRRKLVGSFPILEEVVRKRAAESHIPAVAELTDMLALVDIVVAAVAAAVGSDYLTNITTRELIA